VKQIEVVKPDRVRVRIEVLEDGRLRARTHEELVLAHGDDVEDLRRNVDDAVRRKFGENVRISLLL
jgi:hypothetical protein